MAGFKRYKPNPPGVRSVGQTPGVGAACYAAAQQMAARARLDDPDGAYRAEQGTVTAGWNNERRAGARVVETQRGRGAEKRTLVRLANGRS